MSVIDILFRVDAICKKYDKYDVEKQRSLSGSSDDAFARLFASFEEQIETTLHKAEMAMTETNRATVVAMKAEVRRMKARLLDEVPKLQKLAQKKVKGLSQEELEIRNELVLALPERIQAIPDGSTSAAKQTGGWGASSSHKNINFDSGLDVISEGLDLLKNLAKDMNEELDRQVPLVDEIETKVDKSSAELRNTNVRLKTTLTKVRSSQNFCIDIILLCIILGIATYLYK
ncbi:hypothetical protein RD792_010336 [Penstemon davidsonii]|uniref:t-SNARE coiled-coil homology domain-containing protein n=1 Tax=Penstemon davidsonii TaxID=160366 RepID=A0ABR0D2Q6_9LAMI|nr:hypothetical protein RD792_010336 [Penstemon davidsonii]